MAKPPKPPKPTPTPTPTPAPKQRPSLPDLRTAKPRIKADGLVLLAYDPKAEKVVPVTVQAVLASLADDLPLAADGGSVLSTDAGRVLAGDVRDE